MAKKDKALKSPKKEVARLQKQNDKPAEAIEKTREDQATAHKELRSLFEERLFVQAAGPAEQDGISHEGDEEPEITQAAQRQAGELGIDLSGVDRHGIRGTHPHQRRRSCDGREITSLSEPRSRKRPETM
jgi:hypothetical protein